MSSWCEKLRSRLFHWKYLCIVAISYTSWAVPGYSAAARVDALPKEDGTRLATAGPRTYTAIGRHAGGSINGAAARPSCGQSVTYIGQVCVDLGCACTHTHTQTLLPELRLASAYFGSTPASFIHPRILARETAPRCCGRRVKSWGNSPARRWVAV